MSAVGVKKLLQFSVPKHVAETNQAGQLMPRLDDGDHFAYGSRKTCSVVVLLCNSIRHEVADILKVITRVEPDKKYLDHEMVQILFAWMRESCTYLVKLVDILFDQILSKEFVHSVMNGKLVTSRNLMLWKGSMKFVLCGIVDSEGVFTASLPAGETFAVVVERCKGLRTILGHSETILKSVVQEPRILAKKKAKCQSLERQIWNELKPKNQDDNTDIALRAILTRWMSKKERRKFARNLNVFGIRQTRKIQTCCKLFDSIHGSFPRDIDQMMRSARQTAEAHSYAAGGDLETWATLIQLSRERAIAYEEAVERYESADQQTADELDDQENDDDSGNSMFSYVTR